MDIHGEENNLGCVQEYRGSLQDSPDRFDTDTVHQIVVSGEIGRRSSRGGCLWWFDPILGR